MDENNKLNESIEKWKNKLLDLGKSNNLINYKDTKSSSLQLLKPDFKNAFDKIISSIKTEIFDLNDDFFESDGDGNNSKSYDIETFMSKYNNQIKKSQFVFYNRNNNVRGILKNLKKKSNEALTERGVNVLFLAFGFIKWRDSANSNEYFKSPLLLVPVELFNESIKKPFYIRCIDDIQINPNLSYLFKRNFNIELRNFDDEEDILIYLDKIRKEIVQFDCEVLNEIKLSIFSFNKLSMYLDIEENIDKVKENLNVNAIAGNKVDGDVVLSFKEKEKISNTHDLFINQHNVVDADFSQSEAIEYAISGKSFVLEGPPGTGKSQTITNIIAELLNAGRTVLFVSEKLAALDIVHNNLKKVNLSDFCLQLHSNKTKKKEFVNDLYNTVNLERVSLSEGAQEDFYKLKKDIHKLNEYKANLYYRHSPSNLNFYEIQSKLCELKKYKKLYFDVKNIESKNLSFLSKQEEILNSYKSSVLKLSFDINEHPFKNFKFLNFNEKHDFFEFLKRCEENFKAIQTLLEKIKEIHNIDIENIGDLKKFISFFNFSLLKKLNSNDLNNSYLTYLIRKIDFIKKDSEEILHLDDEIYKIFDDEIFKLDYLNALKIYEDAGKSPILRLFNKKFQNERKKIKGCLNRYFISYKKTVKGLDFLKQRHYKVNLFNEKIAEYIDCFDDAQLDYTTSWVQVERTFGDLYSYMQKNVEYRNFNFKRKKEIDLDSLNNLYNNLISLIDEYNKYSSKNFSDLTSFDEFNNELKILLNNYDLFEEWLNYCVNSKIVDDSNLTNFVKLCNQEGVTLEEIDLQYRKQFYLSLAEYILHKNWNFYQYDYKKHFDDVCNFYTDDKRYLTMSKATIRANIISRFPEASDELNVGPMSILRREFNKSRKIKPIRTLMMEIPELIQTIKPCFLMSPLSVSTYLSKNIQFDTVIFDEASQVFPEDAIVAIYRAKQIIVVGDSQQMPPTNFFKTSDDDEEEYEELDTDIDAFESILDLCKAVFPSKSLLCHYRSRCEALINFSNKNFYNGGLITYPSVNELKNDFGIKFVHVANATFAKYNLIEAEEVAKLVFEHFKNHPERSLGVVAFNIHQQNAIIKVLEKMRAKDSSLEDYFNSQNSEPFFVKNLETVQGDERDTIIFSVTYAKNINGNFAMRFGPLGKKGGERRLNVAVTRAKYNIIVVSSIRYLDIDLTRITNNGPKLLHSYLNYAENGVGALDADINVHSETFFDSPFEKDVYEFLKEKGFSIDTQVGCSKFRIDMALKIPNSSNYVLAIECDGATYHSSKSARDRDRLRQETLERLGRKFYRIWSTDWYTSNKNEKERLLNACNDALKNKETIKANSLSINSDENDDYLVVTKTNNSHLFDEYIDSGRIYGTDFIRTVEEIVKNEGPIHIDNILRRVCGKLGYEHACEGAKKKFNFEFNSYFIQKVDDFFYCYNQLNCYMRTNLIQYVKDINEISLYELRNGMYSIINNQGWATKNELFDTVRRKIGYLKSGDKIEKRLEEAFNLLRRHIIIEDTGQIFINKNNILNLIHRGKDYGLER